MLKIDVIKFETQDVITTSIPNLTPAPAPSTAPICNCNEHGCVYTSDPDYEFQKSGNCNCPVEGLYDHTKAFNYKKVV